MSWTYSYNPEETPKDAVRFLIGDTDKNDPLLQDEEIKSFLDQYSNGVIYSAMRCCEAIAAKFSRRVSESVGQIKMEFQQAAKAYRDMALDLRRRLAVEDVSPFAGGISVAQKIANRENAALVKPAFTRRMMTNRQLSPQTTIGNATDPLQDEGEPIP